jgi:hypothetical protein
MRYCLYLAAFLLVGSAVPADALSVTRVLGYCGDPCVVSHNTGGRVMDFEDAGDAIRRGARQKLVIDGYCASSCMILADRARPKACITHRARFGYHRTNRGRPIPLRGDLNRWIVANGGYPAFNGRPGVMPNEVAARYWRRC